ncbi:hypothetical protein PHLCEN_2v3681 [Hermanssonia centrifuga]|uniref:Hydrophobin n=1 Tax=Hermanssonia centrifuga TaxID=98765 RepID=A0A2R6QEE4_9APHY|nr:hypothetical protein PHLCEN_2v3681 [Hermanssonia centrifuga]
MFARISATSLYVFIALGVLGVATPNPENAKRWGAPASSVASARQSNTGALECCQSVQSVSPEYSKLNCQSLTRCENQSSTQQVKLILGLLGIVLQGPSVLVGLTCSPISVVGPGAGQCNASPVFCNDNSHVSLAPPASAVVHR